MPKFPHLDDPAFPDLGNVDVYKYRNEFDYSRYDHTQMRITLCSVPWDMGEAHIGARTISGIGNVVWFETEAKRDAWFAAIPDSKCIRLETKYKELHRDNQIMLPVPFDVACEYNYLMVEYEPFANPDSLIQYETKTGLDKWFWFIREVEFVSPNTTRVHLMNDAFQTFMYRINLGGMILERGHAPLFAIDADTYLGNPVNNTELLYCEDVNYGDVPRVAASNAVHVYNEETYACIACTANPESSAWGAKSAGTWQTPAGHMYNENGAPAYRIFAMDAANLHAFLTSVDSGFPQFKQTVKGIFFAPKELVTVVDSFTFAGTTCYNVRTAQATFELLELDKTMFRYPARYADLAKLYMWPYACIEVTNESGNAVEIRVEDTSGTIDLKSTLSLAFPVINIQAILSGVGRATSRTVSFANIGEKSFSFAGNWYKTLMEWSVPIFGVFQDAGTHNDYATHFDRVQRKVEYDNALTNALEANQTAYDNANDDSLASYNNAYRNADLIRDNAALTAAANNAIHQNAGAGGSGNGSNVAQIYANAADNVTANNAQVAYSNNFIDDTSNAQILATEQSAAVSAVSGVLSGAATAATSAASGNIPGAVGAAIGGIVNAGASAAQAIVSTNLTSTQAAASKDSNNYKRDASNRLTNALATNAASAEGTTNRTNNVLIAGSGEDGQGGTSGNTASCQELNADETRNSIMGAQGGYYGTANRTKETQDDIAELNKDTAESAVSNSVKQANLETPQEFGIWANMGNATNKPLMVCANIVTQALGAIARAGDEFLRYGYYYNRQWEFDGNWNIGRYFTYWKLADFWVKGLNVPDMYVDKLRFFLYGGVTVWRRPEDIGNVSIYQNSI